VTFITLLKGNWFLCILFPTNPSYWTDVRYLYPWWVFHAGYQWMVLRYLDNALQARKQMCSYLSLVHESLKRFDGAFWCFGNGDQKPHSLSDDKVKMGYITSTCKRAEQVFPLSNLGAQISYWTFPASPDLSSSIQTTNPLGRYLGGRAYVGSSPILAKVALSA
jgi:hypothetical protein